MVSGGAKDLKRIILEFMYFGLLIKLRLDDVILMNLPHQISQFYLFISCTTIPNRVQMYHVSINQDVCNLPVYLAQNKEWNTSILALDCLIACLVL